jgi:hypothetical protein
MHLNLAKLSLYGRAIKGVYYPLNLAELSLHAYPQTGVGIGINPGISSPPLISQQPFLYGARLIIYGWPLIFLKYGRAIKAYSHKEYGGA